MFAVLTVHNAHTNTNNITAQLISEILTGMITLRKSRISMAHDVLEKFKALKHSAEYTHARAQRHTNYESILIPF